MTHTLGEWKIDSRDYIVALRGVSGTVVARLDRAGNGYMERSEINANMRLISAAPDMLAALIDATALLEVYTDPRGRVNQATLGQALSTLRDSRAALAKARGEDKGE